MGVCRLFVLNLPGGKVEWARSGGAASCLVLIVHAAPLALLLTLSLAALRYHITLFLLHF